MCDSIIVVSDKKNLAPGSNPLPSFETHNIPVETDRYSLSTSSTLSTQRTVSTNGFDVTRVSGLNTRAPYCQIPPGSVFVFLPPSYKLELCGVDQQQRCRAGFSRSILRQLGGTDQCELMRWLHALTVVMVSREEFQHRIHCL